MNSRGSFTLRGGVVRVGCAVLALVVAGPLVAPCPALAAMNVAYGVALAHYDEEGFVPQFDFRLDVGMRTGPAFDLGISSIIFAGETDFGVAVPIYVTPRLQVAPRFGGTLIGGFSNMLFGRQVGGRITYFIGEHRGIGFDLGFRTFPSDEWDSAFPIVAGALSLVRRD